MSDSLFIIGEAKRISEILDFVGEASVSGAIISIYDEDGEFIVEGAAAGVEPIDQASKKITIYYQWTPPTPGEFTYSLSYTYTSPTVETKIVRGKLTVWPQFSKLDRYINKTKEIIRDQLKRNRELVERLSLIDYYNAIQTTIAEYSIAKPRKVRIDVNLTANDWVYDLATLEIAENIPLGIPSALWRNEFSEIFQTVYPVDDAVQSQVYLDLNDIIVDEIAAEWQFVRFNPSAGEVARVWWTTYQALDHNFDTPATQDFMAICVYAAGVAMADYLANEATFTNDPRSGAEIVSYRDIQTRCMQQGEALQKRGRRMWQRVELGL